MLATNKELRMKTLPCLLQPNLAWLDYGFQLES